MKKITKKQKLLIGLGSTLALSSAVAIVLQTIPGFDFNNTNISSDVSSRENNIITNEGYNIGYDGFVELGGKNIDGYNIEASTPNVFKGVPNGYVFPIKNENNLKLISIDKNNLTKILWTITFNEVANTEILSVEYLPFQDTIIVMYIESDNGLKVNESGHKWIQVKKIKNISNYIDGSDLTTQATKKTIFTYYYDGSDNFVSYTRADAFGMSPIIRNNNETIELIFYPRVINYSSFYTSTEDKLKFNWFKIYNLETDEIKTINFSINGFSENNKLQAITGLLGIKSDDGFYHIGLFLNRYYSGSGTKLQFEYIKFNDSNTSFTNYGYINISQNNDIDSSLLGNNTIATPDDVALRIKSLPMVPGIWTNGVRATFTYCQYINSFKGSSIPIENVSVHRSSKMMWVGIGLGDGDISNIKYSYMFFNNSDYTNPYDAKSEVFSGYFDISYYLKYGFDVLSEYGLSSFVGIGWKQENNINGFFPFIISGVTGREQSDTYSNNNISNNLNSNNIRIYLLSDNAYMNDTNFYIKENGNFDGSGQNALSKEMFVPGINILSYHISNQNQIPLYSDLLYTFNGGKKGYLINQENRGSNTQSYAKYSFYTRPKKNNFILNNLENVSINEITEEYLMNLLGIGEGKKFQDIEFLTSKDESKGIGILNGVENSEWILKNLNFDINNQIANFDLYTTSLYNNQGQLYTTNYDYLRDNNNNIDDYKVSNIALKLNGLNTIEVNLDVLNNLNITGSINVIDKNVILNVNNEENIIMQAVNNNSTIASKINIFYKLVRTSGGLLQNYDETWMSKADLIDFIKQQIDYANNLTLGIVSFVESQFSIKATFLSGEYVVVDQTNEQGPVQEGLIIDSENIITNINIEQWVNYLQEGKKVELVAQQIRAIVDLPVDGKILSIKAMEGTKGDYFLSGWDFNSIKTTLARLGIGFEFSTDQITWKNNLNELTQFDDSVNKLYMKISASNDSQTKLHNGNELITNQLVVEMNISYSKSITVLDQWIQEFIASMPASGNTKFLDINATPEETLINHIISYETNQPVSNDEPLEVWVEYSIGNTNQWFKRQQFIDYLKSQTTNQTTNEIKFRLCVNPISTTEPVYQIDQTPRVLSVHSISANAAIKIFINNNYENEANSVSLYGTNDQFTYNYGSLPVSPNGEWTGAEGLKIQWSTDPSATYGDPIIDPKWQDTPIEFIDPTTKFLVIRIVAEDGYIYSANYIPNDDGYIPTLEANIHQVNTDNIRFKIAVDLNDLLNLNFEGYSNHLDIDALKTSEQVILDSITNGDKLEIKYKVTLNDGSQLSENWLTADELQQALQDYSTDYDNSTSGLIKFTSGDFAGATISAIFFSKDEQYIPVDGSNGSNNVQEGIVVPTNNIKTKIDLSAYAIILNTVKTELGAGSSQANITGITPPAMTGNKGDSLFAGFTYDEIEQILSQIGVKTEFQAPGSSTGNNWVSKNEISDLNNLKELYIRFVPFKESLNNNIEIIINNVPQNNTEPKKILLKIELPIIIQVNNELLNQLSFEGNTHNLTNFETLATKEQEIINQIKESNYSNNNEINNAINNANIGILYSLDGLALQNDDKIWFTLEEIKDIFENSTTNYGTNKVLAKFTLSDVPQFDDGTPKYQLSSEEAIVINELNKTDEAQFKIYIHNTNQTNPDWIIENVLVIGTQENWTIANYEQWINELPEGLTVEFSVSPSQEDLSQPSTLESDWFGYDQIQDHPLNADKDLWMRFVVSPGYVFESALEDDPKHSAPIKLDTSQVKVNIKLESEWLKSIILAGNTKNLHVNEQAVIDTIMENKDNVNLPTDLGIEIIQIQYTYDDGITWYTKAEFTAKLVEQDGGQDSTNWIILRQNIKARFVLNSELNNQQDTPYGLEIDGKTIEDVNNSPKIQLIKDDENLNSDVRGCINVNKLTPFIASNFEVRGSDENAILYIQNSALLSTMLNTYASEDLISILYASSENEFVESQKVWTPGQSIGSELPLVGNYAERYFAIKLSSINDKYDVYHDNVIQSNGYIISSPDINVVISVSIENPLINNPIVVEFYQTEANGQIMPLYYNNEGAFKALINKEDGTKVTFEEFIDSLDNNQYTEGEKNALELAYYVSSQPLTQEEIDQIVLPEKINNYEEGKEDTKYNVWKSYPTIPTDGQLLNLGLKVDDYVVVALRVKEEFSPENATDGGYIIKDNDFSPTNAERAHGYKVHANEVNVNWSSMKIKNIGKAENASYGLDGYAVLDTISLIPDEQGNYLGVSLELELYNDFYLNNENQILESGSGERLVKREEGTIEGYYKNSDGTHVIDKEGNQVPIYEDQETGMLTAPIKESTAQREKMLIESTTNVFAFEENVSSQVPWYSLFKNQFISIELKNKKGKSNANNPYEYDYYVDDKIHRNYTLTSEIKFPVPNDTNIMYRFNSSNFIDFISDQQNINNNLVYVNATDSTKGPINGESKLIHMFNVIRTENGQEQQILTTLDQINEKIQEDFGGKVTLKITYTSKLGVTSPVNSLDEIKNLSNGDRFRVDIVSADEENYIFAQQPDPLIFTISGLLERGIDDNSLLQYLRVKQNGEFNGEGSFSIFINNPVEGDLNVSFEEYLDGFTFQIRVWGIDKEIKHNWTSDLANVNDLENGDWVEWKLISAETGSDIVDPYYNTVADPDRHNANDGQYAFEQVYLTGPNNKELGIPTNGIGQIPNEINTYPGDRTNGVSGFVISDLKEKSIDDSYTTITYQEFSRVMESLNITYTGYDGLGDMITSRDINSTFVTPVNSSSRSQFSLAYLIDKGYITFYQNNPDSLTDVGQFNWTQSRDSLGNVVFSPGILSNGDKITVRYKDPTMSEAYVWTAPDVYGLLLDQKSDNLSMLTWVGVSVAAVATIGIFIAIYFIARNRKLKK